MDVSRSHSATILHPVAQHDLDLTEAVLDAVSSLLACSLSLACFRKKLSEGERKQQGHLSRILSSELAVQLLAPSLTKCWIWGTLIKQPEPHQPKRIKVPIWKDERVEMKATATEPHARWVLGVSFLSIPF
jgi:hypothetical protein